MPRESPPQRDSNEPSHPPPPPPPLWRELVDRPHEMVGGALLTWLLLGFGVDALTNASKPASYRAVGAGSVITGLLVVSSFWLYRHPASLAGPRWQSSPARRVAAGSIRHAWTMALPLVTVAYWVIHPR